jgi:hypothetical protein
LLELRSVFPHRRSVQHERKVEPVSANLLSDMGTQAFAKGQTDLGHRAENA